MRFALGGFVLAVAFARTDRPSGHRPQQSDCSLFAAAVTVASDSQRTVVIDSTMLGTPMFAFLGASGYAKKPEEQGLALSDSVRHALEAVNSRRESLRECVRSRSGSTVSFDSLVAIFADTGGWKQFRARYPEAKSFVLVSRPLLLADSSALIYVARASDWLNGAGSIVAFRRDATGRWMRQAQAFLWVS